MGMDIIIEFYVDGYNYRVRILFKKDSMIYAGDGI